VAEEVEDLKARSLPDDTPLAGVAAGAKA